MSKHLSRLGYCQYLLTSPTNYTLTNFADHVLEDANQLSGPSWSTVTNVPMNLGEHFAVTVDIDASQRFYRLRKP